jgi:hypothetical protein
VKKLAKEAEKEERGGSYAAQGAKEIELKTP